MVRSWISASQKLYSKNPAAVMPATATSAAATALRLCVASPGNDRQVVVKNATRNQR